MSCSPPASPKYLAMRGKGRAVRRDHCGGVWVLVLVGGHLHLLKAVRFMSSQTMDDDVRITSAVSGQLSPSPFSGTLLSPGHGGHHEFCPIAT